MTRARRGWAAAALALVAFAANSLLCRAALGDARMDPASFTAIRVVAGVVTLVALCASRRRPDGRGRCPAWGAGLLLFVYAASFSWAYRSIEAGPGTLILFASVQATMIGGGLRRGEVVRARSVLGWIVALGGLVALLRPGWIAPDPEGAACMAVAGGAWGLYSLRGQGVADPLGRTADNFLGAAPWALLALAARAPHLQVSGTGVALAAASGALASGVGYALWYAALRGRAATSAAALQMAVPILAALGGIWILGESATFRLLGSSTLVLGGIALSRENPAGDAEIDDGVDPEAPHLVRGV